jgi:hypothetical protein
MKWKRREGKKRGRGRGRGRRLVFLGSEFLGRIDYNPFKELFPHGQPTQNVKVVSMTFGVCLQKFMFNNYNYHTRPDALNIIET